MRNTPAPRTTPRMSAGSTPPFVPERRAVATASPIAVTIVPVLKAIRTGGRRLTSSPSGTAIAKASTTARGGRSSTMATRKASSRKKASVSFWRGRKSG
jgi:hypothetical protein